MKQRLKKELQIADVGHKFDDDELEEMIEEGNMAIFDGGFGKLQQNKKMLDELEIRKNEMLKLESAIQELATLFVEVAALVSEQGLMVDRIANNVEGTEVYVERAVEDIHQAKQYKDSARKKKLYLICCCATIIFIVVISVVLKTAIEKQIVKQAGKVIPMPDFGTTKFPDFGPTKFITGPTVMSSPIVSSTPVTAFNSTVATKILEIAVNTTIFPNLTEVITTTPTNFDNTSFINTTLLPKTTGNNIDLVYDLSEN